MSDAALSLAGPGGIRPIHARWVLAADAVLESPSHFGGQSDDRMDMPLVRDALKGGPLLPGTSLAGALRSHLADVLGGYGSCEDPRVSMLFGMMRSDDQQGETSSEEPRTLSHLIVFDSLGVLPDGRQTEIRDGVEITSSKGTAEEHKRFAFEVLPPKTSFPIRLEVVIPLGSSEAELLSLLATSLSGLAAGEMRMGARRSRGLGCLRIRTWRAHRYDLSSAQGWLAWLLSDPENPVPPSVHGVAELDCALRRAWPDWTPKEFSDRRRRVLLKLDIVLRGGLLVRSPGIGPDAPDASHLTSGGRPVLPGTGLAGVLRNRALRIARLVRHAEGDAEAWVSDLFGSRFEGAGASLPKYVASRLQISEGVIEGACPARPTRVQIDRFTQGVMPTALLDEEIRYGGRANVLFELRNPKTGDLGLLLLLIKDLLSGDLSVGGTASIGRGVLEGSVSGRLENGTQFQISHGQPVSPELQGLLDRAIKAFGDAPPRCAQKEDYPWGLSDGAR